MRKAYDFGGTPSREWLVQASLLYDKVIVNGMFVDGTYATCAAQIDEDLMSSSDPVVVECVKEISGMKQFLRRTLAKRFPQMKLCHEIQQLDGGDSFLESEDHGLNQEFLTVMRERHKTVTEVDVDAAMHYVVDLLTTPPSNVDLHLPDEFPKWLWGEAPANPMMKILVPVQPSKISASQIVDFRKANDLRRVKFQNAVDAMIKQFGDTSGEEDFQRLLKLAGDELQEQQSKLDTIYRDTKIEATAKMVTTIGGPPALLGIIGSVLGISCFEAAGFVASASLSVVPWLVAREKADMAINDSPWAYMWHMRRKLG